MKSSAPERIVVVGSSCAGKTTFARSLAAALGRPYVELDHLYWSANWQPKPLEEFRALVIDAAAAERWVADGNYTVARDQLWPRATTIVWLNYGFRTVLWRALRRTFGRAVSREELWHGNRESFGRALLSRESILWWVITTFHRKRRQVGDLRRNAKFPHLGWIEFRRPSDAKRYLESIKPAR
jgi:adenylate kinase family enzyme